MKTTTITRRQMLKSTAGGAAATAILTADASGAQTKKRIRMGIIGIGNRAKAHIAMTKALADRCRVTATCDIIPDRAREGAQLVGGDVKTFTKHKDLVTAGICEAVIISTPNYTHKEIAVDSLNAGLHVLCEKPMATSLADAREMVAAVNKTGLTFGIGQQMRYAGIYRKVKELLKSGAIGDLKYVWAEEFRSDWKRLYDDPEENAKKNWRYFRKYSGGSLVEKTCHDFDILGWLIDNEPQRVIATGGTSFYSGRETLDHATVAVDYPNGVKLSLGLCMFAKHQANTTLIGSRGTINFPRKGNKITVRSRSKKGDWVIDIAEHDLDKVEQLRHRGTGRLYIEFLDAVSQGRQPFADVNVGYNAIRIPIAAQTAIRQGKIVEMKNITGLTDPNI